MTQGRKVVVIDDSALTLEMTKMALEGAGFRVVALDTPIGAAVVTSQENPDVVLVDVAMASMSGELVVKNLRARMKKADSRMRVLLYSDRSEGELQTLVERCGADGFIKKSGDAQTLVSAVSAALPAG